MDLNYATMAEAVADHVGEQVVLVQGERRSTWAAFDDRASRLAAAFNELGVGREAKVASYLYNCPEYLEGLIATFKVRGVPVNVNYRYLEDELAYLLDNCDAEVVLFDASLADRIAAVRDRLPGLKAAIQVGGGGPLVDGAVAYEDLIATHEPAARVPRSADDILLLYTGGTTGLPKGVMWRCGDLLSVGLRRFYAAVGFELPAVPEAFGVNARTLVERGLRPVHLPASPLMHGSGLGSSIGALVVGGAVVTLVNRTFDPHELWATVARERVTQIAIVGDPFAQPMLRALEGAEAEGRPYDLSSLRRINSTGAMWSAAVKQGLLDRASITLQDGLASSEALAMGMSLTSRDGPATETARFTVGENATVLAEDGREVEPGSGEVGRLAVRRPIPLGYYKDPEKTARTFPTIGGTRYSVPGDYARVEADGTIVLLGRGSVCINTGGEKVFPEEVEELLKEHPAVLDTIVVGVPDARWGEAVAALVSVAPEAEATETDLLEFLRTRLAGYKRPKHIRFVEATPRGPNGKADYAAARELARSR